MTLEFLNENSVIIYSPSYCIWFSVDRILFGPKCSSKCSFVCLERN